MAEATRANIERLGIAHPHNSGGIVTSSLGVTCLEASEADTAHDLVKLADRALYEAKRQGRNRAVLQEASSAAAP